MPHRHIRQGHEVNYSARPESELALIIAVTTTPPHSAYPTFAMVKWAPVPQVDTMRLRWTRVGMQPGEKETAPDLRGCQISGSCHAVGLAGFEPATS
jgi:hypothetical protein